MLAIVTASFFIIISHLFQQPYHYETKYHKSHITKSDPVTMNEYKFVELQNLFSDLSNNFRFILY